MLLRKHDTFFYTFHMVGTSQPPNFNDRPLFKPWTLWFAAILKCLKTNIFASLKQFSLKKKKKKKKTIPSNTEFTIMEKKFF